MRTTLDIEDDVLIAVKAIANERKVSAGKAISDLVRTSLTVPPETINRNGVPVFPVRPDGQIVTMELVNKLRDEES